MSRATMVMRELVTGEARASDAKGKSGADDERSAAGGVSAATSPKAARRA